MEGMKTPSALTALRLELAICESDDHLAVTESTYSNPCRPHDLSRLTGVFSPYKQLHSQAALDRACLQII